MKAVTLGILICLMTASIAHGEHFWSIGAQQSDGWYGTEWYGWVIQIGDDPSWMYHAEHGWTYSTASDPDNVYWWCDNTGWCWFSQTHYPWLYRMDNGRWLLYSKGSNVWYYDPLSDKWIERPAYQIDNQMILVEEGSFKVVNRPTQVSSFYIGKYEVTWGEWLDVRTWAAANGYDIGTRGKGCADTHPVRYVNWYDAVKWCNARSEKEGLTPVYYTDASHTTVYRTGNYKVNNSEARWEANGYRLPTEAEWQYAAMGGLKSGGHLYSGSNDLDTVAWHSLNAAGAACDLSFSQAGLGTWPVGEKLPNELGIYDMSGNVEELCWDWHGNIFGSDPVADPQGPDTGRLINRISRGGGWAHTEYSCQVATRSQAVPNGYGEFVGFRVVRISLVNQ